MSGNAWEWCWDWNNLYSSYAEINPTGSTEGSYRSNRGGGYYNSAFGCRNTGRSGDTPLKTFGFRVVRRP